MIRSNNIRLYQQTHCQIDCEEMYEPLLVKKIKLDTSVSLNSESMNSDTDLQSESQSIASMIFSSKSSLQIIDIFQSVMNELENQEELAEDKWDGQCHFSEIDYAQDINLEKPSVEVSGQTQVVQIAVEPKNTSVTPLNDSLWTPFSKQKKVNKKGQKGAKAQKTNKGRNL